MYQTITLVGNVGQDAEMRLTPQGVAVTNFNVAVNERYGETETTTWFRVTCWRKLAEVCAEYVTKGKLVLVTGRVQARAYTNRQGAPGGHPACTLEVTADTVKFLSSNGQSSDAQDKAPTYNKNGATTTHTEEASLDIPF